VYFPQEADVRKKLSSGGGREVLEEIFFLMSSEEAHIPDRPLPTINIELKPGNPNDIYQCPQCSRFEQPKNFSRLNKHAKAEHKIALTHIKINDSTKRKKEQISKQVRKKQPILHKPKIPKSPNQVWQNQISVLPENVTTEKLKQFGVLVVRNFLAPREVDVLNGCVEMAKRDVKDGKLVETSISGGTLMINIPVVDFKKDTGGFKFGIDTLEEISSRIKNMVGDNFSIVGDLSILTTPNGAEKQCIHADNILKNRYNGLLVLSETASPTRFLPKENPDIMLTEAPLLHPETGMVMNGNLRQKIQEKYSFMWGSVEELDSKMRPVSDGPLKKGDLVLFEADMVHRGAACEGNKTLVFFQVRPGNPANVEKDVQFHAGLLGSYVYGELPESKEDKDAYFGLIRRHDKWNSNAKVPLTELLANEVRIAYEEWLDQQPSSHAI
jgi:hypothetical protein